MGKERYGEKNEIDEEMGERDRAKERPASGAGGTKGSEWPRVRGNWT